MIEIHETENNKEEKVEWVETADEYALRRHIFNTDDREELLVEVPQWRTKVLLKALTGAKRAEFMALMRSQQSRTDEFYKGLQFELVLHGCLHPTTKRSIFQPADRGELMGQKNGALLQLLAEMIQQLSRIDSSTSDLAKKNLSGIQGSTVTTNWQRLLEE